MVVVATRCLKILYPLMMSCKVNYFSDIGNNRNIQVFSESSILSKLCVHMFFYLFIVLTIFH